MIVVDEYLTQYPTLDSTDRKAYWLLLKYFSLYKDTFVFRTHMQIARALTEEFDLPKTIAQSALSKALSYLYDEEIRIEEKSYSFVKALGGYRLHAKGIDIESLYPYAGFFKQKKVHRLSDSTLVFHADEGLRYQFKKQLEIFVDPSLFFGIMSNDDFLILMFNPDHPSFEDAFNRFEHFFEFSRDFSNRIPPQDIPDYF